MTEKLTIIALLVLSIHYTMQEEQIFERLGKWFERALPEAIHKPVFACNVCMTPWYGTLLYWLIPWQKLGLTVNSWLEWPVVIIGAMGINIVINKWAND
jgi:hypothetical protein